MAESNFVCGYFHPQSIGNHQRVGIWRNGKEVKIPAPYFPVSLICELIMTCRVLFSVAQPGFF
jgi:hypothetical protein